jgi:hypothetical protein
MTSRRVDGWANYKTGLGGSRGRNASTVYSRRHWSISAEDIEALRQNALFARICDAPAEDATSTSIVIDGVDAVELRSLAEDLSLYEVIADAIRWDYAYGGALIVADDGRSHDEPLGGTITGLTSIEAASAVPERGGYTIEGLGWVDSSRAWRLVSSRLSHRQRVAGRGTFHGWGYSVAERIYDELAGVGESREHARELLHVLSVPVLHVDGLADILAGESGAEDARAIGSSLVECMDSLGLLLIDGKDRVSALNRQIAGVVELMHELADALASAAPMPVEILLKRRQNGLSGGDDRGAYRDWYGYLESYRRRFLAPLISKILEHCDIRLPQRFEVKFDPLWKPTAKEELEIAKMQAEIGAIDIASGVRTVEEVRKWRGF